MKSLKILIILVLSLVLISCIYKNPKQIRKQNSITSNQQAESTAMTKQDSQLFKFYLVHSFTEILEKDISGVNFYNRETMVLVEDKIFFIKPDFGHTIISCGLNGENGRIFYCINNSGYLWRLKYYESFLYFIVQNEGLYKISTDGSNIQKLVEGNVQDYFINDQIIYYSVYNKYESTESFELKYLNVESNEIKEIDKLSIGNELLKVGGYLIGIYNHDFIYTKRDQNYKRSYFAYKEGQITPFSYKDGQQIEIEMAKKNLRPLDLESSEVRHVDGKSLTIEYNEPNPNTLFLTNNNTKKKIAEVKGDYVYCFNNQIYILDKESNIEHLVFNE